VGNKLRESLKVENIGIGVYDEKSNIMQAPYIYRAGKRLKVEPFALNAFNFRVSKLGKTLVVNKNAEKHWQKLGAISVDEESPKAFVMVPLMAGKELVGGIAIQNFENEHAFSDLSVDLLETIASNMGTPFKTHASSMKLSVCSRKPSNVPRNLPFSIVLANRWQNPGCQNSDAQRWR
jgi:transcriptional regulator with GAF, ATPase, and Fis domain